jgi:glutamate-5-semialdehyde dehydrogenase
MTLDAEMDALGRAAKAAAAELALVDAERKSQALQASAGAIRKARAAIIAANAADMAEARARGLSAAKLDRLELTADRIEAMAAAVEQIAELPDPVGRQLARWTQPNGLDIARVAVPLGVIGVIYESRPNVTADAAALCLKAGNAVILRGGSDSFRSAGVILEAMREGLAAANLPLAAIQRVPVKDRDAVGLLLAMADWIDVIVPRGGKPLIERVQREARMPIFSHLDGISHSYVDQAANLDMAKEIAMNAKMRRTGICGAMETLLVHEAVAADLLERLIPALQQRGCEVRGDARVQALAADVVPASDADWDSEYLDAILSIKVVTSLTEAMAHINRHGSHHTDAIITEDETAAETFLREVDSAIVLVNASSQFADGGEFGMGAEIGIATGRMHARGPVGAAELCTYKYQVRGSGQTRP